MEKCSGEISAIYLVQNFRAIGLGKQLLNWCLEKLKDLGYTTAILWVLKENKNAISFYEKQGFWHDGIERKIFRDIELSQIRYKKALI
ncbi:GNAT family N-acetyltransferase [Paenibacillus sp. GP183]|uniref:GNAT family N-acetyltransferase n=1 Tax=Paenibacillus sp. GP183 TaxID=1882751 RepID=UPI000B8A25C0|nr:GNAT family N-acetyltransferase [Paenibacillus sp. GP183]